ncbi:MAG: hypothetical protein AAFW89_12310 [Bacteroidota bacterium]
MFRKYVLANLTGLVFVILTIFFVERTQFVAILSGFLLSTIFVLSSAWVINFFWDASYKTFIKAFFISLVVRFVLVLALFGVLLGVTKIQEIFFTVSFIISYLCQSVMEMIFINQILKKSSSQK